MGVVDVVDLSLLQPATSIETRTNNKRCRRNSNIGETPKMFGRNPENEVNQEDRMNLLISAVISPSLAVLQTVGCLSEARRLHL